jgi:hypothetical protein
MSETLQSPSPIPNLPDWYQFPLLKWRMSLDYQRSLAYLQEDGESRPLLLTKAGAVKLLEPTEPIVSLFPHPLGGFLRSESGHLLPLGPRRSCPQSPYPAGEEG